MNYELPIAMTIAGSDSGGGAGIEMDLKVFSALGVYGTCAITALTAQNSVGVRGAWEVSSEAVTTQIEAVLDDLPVCSVKTGMLSSERIVQVVAELAERRALPQLVVDPVVVAKDGTHLLSEAGIKAVIERLLPLALLVTPNIPEAETLTGHPIRNEKEALRAGQVLRALGCDYVLLKGGHEFSGGKSDSREAVDLLIGPEEEHRFSAPRAPSGPFHGTGCALSAAIAAFLARGMGIMDAVGAGWEFVQGLIRDAHHLGHGAMLLHPVSANNISRSKCCRQTDMKPTGEQA